MRVYSHLIKHVRLIPRPPSDAGYGRLHVDAKDCHGNEVPVELWKKDDETKVRGDTIE